MSIHAVSGMCLIMYNVNVVSLAMGFPTQSGNLCGSIICQKYQVRAWCLKYKSVLAMHPKKTDHCILFYVHNSSAYFGCAISHSGFLLMGAMTLKVDVFTIVKYH